jgi:hypothetical protein
MRARTARLGLVAVCTWLLTPPLAACNGSADESSTTGARDDAGAHAGVEDDFQGCPEDIPRFAPGLQAAGDHVTVKLITAMPDEPERHINNWKVELGALDGTPARDAEILRAEPFMPIHGHDGRVVPHMTALAEPGQFQVDRLNFIMRGPWEVRFWLSSSLGEDFAVFHVCVAK